MNKKEVYDTFAQLEKDATATLEQLQKMKHEVELLMESNTALSIENQHLRDRLAELEKQEQLNKEMSTPEMSQSRLNLEKIYEEGFHVCNVFYGSRRVEDEPCAFCIDVIYGERK
ncbi:initiation-control protein YabA [Lacticigenium naphthae]|uniref:initiation-control protein YabA n=1 Tax=Lacticigenium naphthae TaxID=515351 RepID=UPI0003F9406E|nr:DNA replication initiation control protein YabA [Lacticigenium naphthae]